MKPEDKAKVQQALDLLDKQWQCSALWSLEESQEAAEALRQLLEQTDQEPAFYWDRDCFFVRPERAKFLNLDVDAMQALYATPPAQPSTDHSEQDLDMVDHGDELTIAYLDGVHTGKKMAKREWVGLTDEEKMQIVFDAKITEPNDEPIKFGRPSRKCIEEMVDGIDAKLREKNGGGS